MTRSVLRSRGCQQFGVLRLRWGACALACASIGLFACDQPGPRVYSAMAYDTTAQCLEPYAPLGLVQAEDLPATCQPVCLMVADKLYVSEVCEPYPAEATVVQATGSADCATALSLIGMDGGGACETDTP